MSNSALASVRIISPNKSSPRSKKIDCIAIHCMAGNLSAEACGNLFASSSRQASSNYGIGSDGTIGIYVDEGDRSWCTSDSIDEQAVTIEVANTSGSEPFPVSKKAYASLLNLVTDICRRNKIKKLKWLNNKTYGLQHRTDLQNMVVHRWYANKSCPGNYLFSVMGDIAKEVNRRLDGNEPIDTMPAGGENGVSESYSSSTGDDSATSSWTVDYENLDPYILTLSRDTHTIKSKEWDNLKSMRVSGVMVEAGALFTSEHTKHKNFENPKLDKQITSVKSSKLAWGLYTYVRCKSVKEAQQELEALRIILRRYPPELGIWLKPTFTKNKSVNDNILKTYYNELVRLGLKNKMGIICKKSDLDRFSWEKKWSDHYCLWLVKHVSDVNSLEKLLTPKFFLSGKGANASRG